MSAAQGKQCSFYTKFISSCLFPLHEYYKQHDSVSRRRTLEETQWLKPEALEAVRITKLNEFLTAIERTVPYYRSMFASIDFNPSKVDSLQDLSKLPFLTKKLIKEHTYQLKSTTASRLIRYNTGGSSGEPLIFYMGMDRVSQDVAAKWRATRWWDVDIGDREIVIWGSPIELSAQDSVRRFRDALFRSKLLSAFEMSEQKLDDFVRTIKVYKPRMLFGYPSALSHIASYAERRGISFEGADIRVAFVTSEKLYDDQRATISRVFGCAVANGYGGRDAGFIAHECPSGGMHLTAEDIIVEIIGDDGRPVPSGVAGEIVVTHTSTQDFPFVRYKTGDIGVLCDRMCACGRGLPLLEEIQGRTTDFLRAMDGTILHGLALIYVIRGLPQVEAFKIIQERMDRIRINVVPSLAGLAGIEEHLVKEVKMRMGNEMDVIVEAVKEIDAEKSGKHRYVVNLVESR